MGSQYIRANDKTSSVITNNRGVDFLPFFTLHTSDHYPESFDSFLEYAGDVVIGHLCKDSQGIFTIKNVFQYVSVWFRDNDLNLKLNYCVQCMFTLKGNDVTNPDLKANISGYTLSEVESGT